jgi:hypothetical protein
MQDYWTTCYEPDKGMDPETFKTTFCDVCRNHACERSRINRAKWQTRVATQMSRLFGTDRQVANPNDPKYDAIRHLDFPSALREAMRLEISDKKGDWSIPTEQDAQEYIASMTEDVVSDEVEVKIPYDKYTITKNKDGWSCTCPAWVHGRTRPCKHIKAVEHTPVGFQKEEPVKPEPVIDQLPANLVPPQLKQPNAPNQSGKIIGGGVLTKKPAPPVIAPKRPVHDEWSVPKKPDNIIPVGGKVVLKGDGNNE